MFGCRNQLQTQFSGRYGASGAIGKTGPGANELNEPRIPAQYHELLVKNSLGCLSELGYPMLHHWLLIKNDHLGWLREVAWRNARQLDRSSGGQTWSHRGKLPFLAIVAPMVEICWDAQKRTLTLEYLRNLPEYQPPRFHLAYVTASNYLWTLYTYIYISIMKAFLFSLVKYTNLQIMMNMMNMTRSSIEYKSPFWLFKSPFFLVELC